LDKWKLQVAQGGSGGESPQWKEWEGVPYTVHVVAGLDEKSLRTLSDQLKEKVSSGVVIVASQRKKNHPLSWP